MNLLKRAPWLLAMSLVGLATVWPAFPASASSPDVYVEDGATVAGLVIGLTAPPGALESEEEVSESDFFVASPPVAQDLDLSPAATSTWSHGADCPDARLWASGRPPRSSRGPPTIR